MSVTFRVPKILWIGSLILAFSGGLFGQNSVSPAGGEFSILGPKAGDQVWPSLSLSANEGVIVWEDQVIDKVGGGLGGTLLDENFNAMGSFRVNKTITGDKLRPQVQLLANNNFITVWQSSVAGTPDIYARLSKNTAKGADSYGTNFYSADIRLNACLADQQVDPSVAALPDGSAIITWASYGQDGSMWGVYARRLTAAGRCTTAREFLVPQYTSSNQRKPKVATLANGNYVITWISEQERFFNSVDVYARIFKPTGVPVTEEIAVNSATNTCDTPDVAPLNDGGFTVVWSQLDSQATNGWDIWGRAFSATGSPEVSDFRINTHLYGDQYRPVIAAGPSGSLVAWTSLGQDGSREGVFGRFLPGGTQVGADEFQVNTTYISQQLHPTVAWNGVDRFLVAWTSFGTSGFDLYGQVFTLSNSP